MSFRIVSYKHPGALYGFAVTARPSPAYRFGKFRLVVSTRELWRDDAIEVLPRRVFDCLLYLLERRDRAVGRDELAAAIWERVDVSDGQIGQLVMRLRRLLDDDGQVQAVVRTIPGFGYRWVCPVEPVVDALDSPDARLAATAPLATPPSPVHSRGYRLVWLAALAMLAIVAALTLSLRSTGPAAGADEHGITLVLPVTTRNDDGDSAWMRLGLMDLIADHLRLAELPVPQSEHAIALTLQSSEAEPSSGMPAPDGFPPAARVGRVIQVQAERLDEGWRIELDALASDGSRHHQSAEDVDAVVAARRATDRLLAALGHLPAPAVASETALDERLQRAQAALLTNELDTAHQILLSAEEPDRLDPRVRLRLAQIDFRAGRIDSAKTALDTLIDEPSSPGLSARLRSQALRSRGSLHIRIGQDADAERDFDRASELAPESAQTERGWALNGRAVARLILGRLDEAAADLGRARVYLERAGEVHGVLSVDNNMGLLELTRLRPAQAIAHSDQAARQFEALGTVNEALSAQSVAIEAHLSQLQWHEALAVNERGWNLRHRVHDPDMLLTLSVLRARILLGLGRLGEAAALLEASERSLAQAQAWNRAEQAAVVAELSLLTEDPINALGAVERALELQPMALHSGRRTRIALMALHLVGASATPPAAADDPSAGMAECERCTPISLAISESLRDIDEAPEPADRSPYLLLASAENGAAQSGPIDQTDQRYQAALAAAEQRGLPAEIAAAADSYGRWLLAAGREADAAAVIGRIAPWSERDFDCAVAQVALFHAQGDVRAWSRALERAQRLAGERTIPAPWKQRPTPGQDEAIDR